MNRQNSDSRTNELGIHDVLECRGDPILLQFRIPLHLGTLGLDVVVLSLGIAMDCWRLLVLTGAYKTPGASFRILQGVSTCTLRSRVLRQ